MAKRKKAALSAGFDAARLDAIGAWTAAADEDNLDITWRRPAALQVGWVPLNLRFHTDSGSASFDPDDRMFGLWELFLSRREEFVAQLRAVTAEAAGEMGAVVRGRVEVYREGGSGDDDGDSYSLQVYFRFADEDEHACGSVYDEDAGRFGPLEG